MNRDPNESLYFTALLVLLGGLALYGGWRWLGVLVPAAILVWLAASVRCHARRAAVDARVDNRSASAVGK